MLRPYKEKGSRGSGGVVEVILSLLYGAFGLSFGVDFGLENVDGLVEIHALVARTFAAREVGIGMDAGDVGAEAIEVDTGVLAGVQRGKAVMQGRERRASIGKGNIAGQDAGGL